MGKKKKVSPTVIILIVATVILTLLIAAVAAVMYYIGSLDTIYPNVYIAGINVGDMTEEQALEALNNRVKEVYGSLPLPVELPDRSVEFEPELIGVRLSSDEAVTSAHDFGRSGNIFSKVGSYIKAYRSEVAYTVNAGITINEEAIRDRIAQLAREVHVDMAESKATVYAEEDYIEIKTGTTGIDIDQEALYNEVSSAVLRNDFNTITFPYIKTAYPSLDLSSIYNDVYIAVADAYYDSETHEIVPEQIGYGFDLAASNQQIAMSQDQQTLRVQLEEVPPATTKAELEEIYFAHVLSSFQTGSLGGSNRTNNITLACQALNGTVLNPGEVFSYNGTVGQRTSEKGYKAAGAYVGGKSVSEVGGGICQVSSTLYYCTLLANLEIVSRTCHMFTVGYVNLGMDATVSWPNPDFQFKNDTEYPIRIEAKVEGGLCKIALIGTKTDNIEVKMTYAVLSTIPYTTIVTEDEDEVNSTGRTGYNVVTYRHLIDSTTGNEISNAVEAYSYYQKTDIVVLKKDLEDEINDRLEEEENQENEGGTEGGEGGTEG